MNLEVHCPSFSLFSNEVFATLTSVKTDMLTAAGQTAAQQNPHLHVADRQAANKHLVL